jgi:hypothetical protein
MTYRVLGKAGIRVSEIGLGCEHLEKKEEAVVRALMDDAIEAGINIFDVFMSEPNVRTYIGNALDGRRHKAVIQGHIGAAWRDGQYARSREIDEVKRNFDDLLIRMKTDYIDIGLLHFVDEESDASVVLEGPMMEYALELKRQGVIKAVGVSSHNPVIARRAAETGLVDMLMFSLNPAWDVLPETEDVNELFKPEIYEGRIGPNETRQGLYKYCEAAGVGITVMKSLGAGALLNAQTSPFGVALSPVQCMHYALTRPAVSSVLVGCQTAEEIAAAVAYERADDAQKDYSVILSKTPKFSLRGKCMYCNHCLPCPSRIDVAYVNRYLDTAELNGLSPSIREHYTALTARAGDCTECGSCEKNCPFGVPVIKRMRAAAKVFGG